MVVISLPYASALSYLSVQKYALDAETRGINRKMVPRRSARLLIGEDHDRELPRDLRLFYLQPRTRMRSLTHYIVSVVNSGCDTLKSWFASRSSMLRLGN